MAKIAICMRRRKALRLKNSWYTWTCLNTKHLTTSPLFKSTVEFVAHDRLPTTENTTLQQNTSNPKYRKWSPGSKFVDYLSSNYNVHSFFGHGAMCLDLLWYFFLEWKFPFSISIQCVLIWQIAQSHYSGIFAENFPNRSFWPFSLSPALLFSMYVFTTQFGGIIVVCILWNFKPTSHIFECTIGGGLLDTV